MELIDQNILDFITFFDEISHSKGNKWDDIVIKHEWNCEITSLLSSLNPNYKDIVESASKK